MYVLSMLIMVLQVASAVAALFTVFKPGVSERTRQTAFGALAGANLLAAVFYLMNGLIIVGTVFAVLAVLLLITWWPVLRFWARWVRARRGDKSTK
ncbi:hypothetical protein ACIQGT_25935 [Streptomyces sp. NPDC093108]|uniref:hypothetical protein n=1 Tax=Streptomyces sp. NPDC093108 TaxID=3366030 RepID=UPI0038287D50